MLEKIKRLFKKDDLNFDDNSDFDFDKKIGRKEKFKFVKKAKDESLDFDDSTDFDLNEKSNKKAKGKRTRVKDDRDFSFSDPDEKEPFKFKFKWWMLIPVVVILAIVIAVVAIGAAESTYDKQVSQVAISSLPEKLVYYVGEQPSYTGLTITTTFNNGTTFTEGPESCTFSGFNSEFAEEEQHITITYGEHTFVYTITIKEPVKPFSPLVNISLVTLPKTEYKVGDWLNVNDGVLLLEYEDGSTRRIRLEHNHIRNFSSDNPGNFTITVKVVEDGYLATCTYDITVTE